MTGQDATDLKEAVDNGTKLIVSVNATRNNVGFFGDIPQQAKDFISQFLAGALSPTALLTSLRAGKVKAADRPL
jgi:hypothetical protein